MLKTKILSADDIKFQTVPVPEWDTTLRVYVMTGAERDAFESGVLAVSPDRRQENMRARLLVHCLRDEQGTRIFEASDADALGAKSGAALSRLFDVAADLNRLTKAHQDELLGN
jgi:hypothetical protein